MSATVAARREARFHITFEREYHVGAGHGRGAGLDSALFVEGDGSPAVRYIHGLLRQAVYDLLRLEPLAKWRQCSWSDPSRPYDQDEFCRTAEAREDCPVCRIFGSPAAASPWRFSTLRPITRTRPGALEGRRTVRRSSVDLRTRVAADKKLFAEELGPALSFEFVAQTSASNRHADADLAMLWAALHSIPGIGADRRRGRGQCKAALVRAWKPVADDAALVDAFRTYWLDGRPAAAGTAPASGSGTDTRAPAAEEDGSPPTPAPALPPSVWSRANAADYLRLKLLLRLEEPAIVGTRPLTGNVTESEDYIPGTLLWGALAAVAVERGMPEADLLRVFRSGAALVPDLIPLFTQGSQCWDGLPAPRDLYTCPDPDGGLGHALVSGLHPGPEGKDARAVQNCPACGQKLEAVGGYVYSRSSGPKRWAPDLRPETKIAIDPSMGRVLAGSLYHRESVPAGQLLGGELLITQEALRLLRRHGILAAPDEPLELGIGKRFRRGYGRARLVWGQPAPADDAADRRAPAERRIRHFAERLGYVPILLCSRLLLRGPDGRYVQRLEPAVFLPPDTTENADASGVASAGCAVAWGPTGGFWGHIGLPRRLAPALLPGSVLHVLTDGLDAGRRDALVEALVRLQIDGLPLGERTEEGYGRFHVAPFMYDHVQAAADRSTPAREVIPPDPWIPASSSAVPPALASVGIAEPVGSRDRSLSDLRNTYRKLLEGEPAFRVREQREQAESGVADRWRSIARVLYANADMLADEPDAAGRTESGEPVLAAIIERVQQGSGEPASELRRHGRRGRQPFLEGDGADAWASIERHLRQGTAGIAAGAELAEHVRAFADAIEELAQRSSDL